VSLRGSPRLLFSLESPEGWLEDFGESKMTRGKARVKLDRDGLVPIYVEQASSFYAQHPQLVQGLGAGALALIMSHMSKRT